MTTGKNIKLFYLSNLSTFMISSKNGDSIWKTNLCSVYVCVLERGRRRRGNKESIISHNTNNPLPLTRQVP